MRRAGPVSAMRAGSNTGMKLFVEFIWKIVLLSEVKMKSSCKKGNFRSPEAATGGVLAKKLFLKTAALKVTFQSKFLKNTYEEVHF